MSKNLDEAIERFEEDLSDTTPVSYEKAISKFKAAIVEVVEGLIPPEKELAPNGMSERIGFNECRSEVLQAIKEWQ